MARPTKAQSAQIAARRTEAISLRAAGQTWDQIAEKLGYATRSAACEDVARALQQRIDEQNDQADHLRAIEVEHLEALRRRLWSVSQGKDIELALKATDRLVRIGERLAKLTGLDAPVAVDAGVTLRYEVVGVDAADHT